MGVPEQKCQVKRDIVKARKEDCGKESWSSREKVGGGLWEVTPGKVSQAGS